LIFFSSTPVNNLKVTSTPVEGKVNELINPENVQVEIISLDNNAAKEVILASQWAGGLIEASLEKILLETKKELIPDLFKFLVQQNISLLSIRSTNTLESYFLSITK
jgi:phage replication-related protein YjqB (UPF0714/DUF867 family)